MLAATKASFTKTLEALVRKFDADRETYLSAGYGEAQARSHFITPLFKASDGTSRTKPAFRIIFARFGKKKAKPKAAPTTRFG
jgi:hypothetical protein